MTIMHRDLKPDNILLTRKDFSAVLKIVDFGLSRKWENTDLNPLTTGVGTPVYAAPEILNRISDYTEKVDLWSLGMVLFEMLFGKCIFENAENLDHLKELQLQTETLIDK